MSKITVIKREEIELEKGMIFKRYDWTYILAYVGKDAYGDDLYVLTCLESGSRYNSPENIEQTARTINSEGDFEFIGYGKDFQFTPRTTTTTTSKGNWEDSLNDL